MLYRLGIGYTKTHKIPTAPCCSAIIFCSPDFSFWCLYQENYLVKLGSALSRKVLLRTEPIVEANQNGKNLYLNSLSNQVTITNSIHYEVRFLTITTNEFDFASFPSKGF